MCRVHSAPHRVMHTEDRGLEKNTVGTAPTKEAVDTFPPYWRSGAAQNAYVSFPPMGTCV